MSSQIATTSPTPKTPITLLTAVPYDDAVAYLTCGWLVSRGDDVDIDGTYFTMRKSADGEQDEVIEVTPEGVRTVTELPVEGDEQAWTVYRSHSQPYPNGKQPAVLSVIDCMRTHSYPMDVVLGSNEHTGFARGFRGSYIAVDGIDGSGKSSLTKSLLEALELRGAKNVTRVREPSDGEHGRRLRTEDLTGAETYAALICDRKEQMPVIDRLLASGSHVISDRCYFSTLAYQTFGEGAMEPEQVFMDHNGWCFEPDVFVWLVLDTETALARVRGAVDKAEQGRESGELARFENEEQLNHCHEVYTRLAVMRGSRNLPVVVLNARLPIEELVERLLMWL